MTCPDCGGDDILVTTSRDEQRTIYACRDCGMRGIGPRRDDA